ncbi:Twin-arginine translocation protein TatB, partial [hydrothermal vent metagenome]
MKRLAVVSAFLVVVAACGGTTKDTTDPGTGSDGTTTTSSAPADVGSLTMADFIPGFDPDLFNETDYRAQELKIQESVATCMAAEGFEYIPFVQSDIGGGLSREDFGGLEYAKEYGLGISTYILQEQGRGQTEEDFKNQDPNQPIIDAMTEGERDEYFRLLYGGEPQIIVDTPQSEIEAMSPEERDQFFSEAYDNWEPEGCFYEAQTDVFNQGAAEAFYEEFGDRLSTIFMRIESDPRIVEANKQWTVCMTEKGQAFEDPQAMYEYFDTKVNEVMGWSIGRELESEEGSVSGTTMVVFDSEGGLSGEQYDKEALQAIMDEEIDAAVANVEC